jgi:hypothetical protein
VSSTYCGGFVLVRLEEPHLGRRFDRKPRIVKIAAINSGLFADLVHQSLQAVRVSAAKARLSPIGGLVAIHERREMPPQEFEVSDLGVPLKK